MGTASSASVKVVGDGDDFESKISTAAAKSAGGSLTKLLLTVAPVAGNVGHSIVEEDCLAFRKLQLELYRVIELQPQRVNPFLLALFIAMSHNCRLLLRGYEALKKALPTGGNEGDTSTASSPLRRSAAAQPQRDELLKEIIKANYRFKKDIGGYSQMVTHCLLHSAEFCVSLLYVVEDEGGKVDHTEHDNEEHSKRKKKRKNKGGNAGPKNTLVKVVFRPNKIQVLSIDQTEKYVATREFRVRDGVYTLIKSDPSAGSQRKKQGICGHFPAWKELAQSILDTAWLESEREPELSRPWGQAPRFSRTEVFERADVREIATLLMHFEGQ